MGKVLEMGICTNKGDKIISLNEVQAIRSEGLANDRKSQKNNNIKRQLTLIEIENINYYNKMFNLNIPAINFRRNIITKDIKLNNLIGKEFFVGKVKIKAHDLCRPCEYLQNLLNQKNFVKEFWETGGIRCEILTSEKITVGDIIKI